MIYTEVLVCLFNKQFFSQIQKSGLSSLSKPHMEIFAFLAESITNNGDFQNAEFKKWRLVYSQVKDLIMVAMSQADCVRHSVSCLKIMAKFKLFQDTKVWKEL